MEPYFVDDDAGPLERPSSTDVAADRGRPDEPRPRGPRREGAARRASGTPAPREHAEEPIAVGPVEAAALDAAGLEESHEAGMLPPRRRKVRRAASSAEAWARRGTAPSPSEVDGGEFGRAADQPAAREPEPRYQTRDIDDADRQRAEFRAHDERRRETAPLSEDLSPQPLRHAVDLDESRIDPDVQKVLRRLVRHGHEAYLVGGCVRDLLLGRRPKDFDVATSARPEEVRDLFRNSRIIGRRFRLVHVLFQGGKVIEVATFRRNPKDETEIDARSPELLIRSDNAFGLAHEDAMRRDFTINALFYDIDSRTIIDWVGGMADIERRVVHTIGDPETRFREDPIRMLRALKFAGRLGLAITADVYDAIVYCRDALGLAARPRLSEEILRLLRGGAARRTVYLAWETGVLDVVLPELAALLYDDDGHGPGSRVWRLLDYLDRRHAAGAQLDDTVLWTVLLLEPLREACEGARDRGSAAAALLEPLTDRLAVSRRFADGMRRIMAIMPRLHAGKAGRFARTELFGPAVEVTLADLTARGLPTAAVERLRGGERPRRGAVDAPLS